MRFYVDECLPNEVADEISRRRGHRAVHAVRDLGFGNREDEFHIEESRRRGEILVTKNHLDFKRGFEALRSHPGIVVFRPHSKSNSEDLVWGVDVMFRLFRMARIGAKPPQRNDLRERRLVISGEVAYVEDSAGYRYYLYPEARRAEGWQPSPQPGKRRAGMGARE